ICACRANMHHNALSPQAQIVILRRSTSSALKARSAVDLGAVFDRHGKSVENPRLREQLEGYMVTRYFFPVRAFGSVARRFGAAVVAAIAMALGAVALHADQKVSLGPNVNLVGGPTFLKLSPFLMRGDPLRAQQFESSCVFN